MDWIIKPFSEYQQVNIINMASLFNGKKSSMVYQTILQFTIIL